MYGVDVHILVRHNFYEVENFEKSRSLLSKLSTGLEAIFV